MRNKGITFDTQRHLIMANANGTESIKLQSKIVEKVRENKKKTGVPITTFIEQATTEKLNKKQKK